MHSSLSKGLGAGCAVAPIASCCALSGHAAQAPAPSATNSPAIKAEIPQSVFVIPSSPKEGRNPFFPGSVAAAAEVQTPSKNGAAIEPAAFVLNGITSPPKRMAMINGRSFETGETGDVKLPNGQRITIRCLEIHDDRVVIMIAGQKRELQLRSKWA